MFLQGSPHEPCLSGPCSKMNKSLSLPSAPAIFQPAGSVMYLYRLFVMQSLQGLGVPFLKPPGSPRAKPADFQNSSGCKNSKFGPSCFQRQMLWELVLFVCRAPQCGSLFFCASLHYRLPPHQGGHCLFCSQRGCCPSCLLQCGLSSTFSCGGCCARIQIVFWVIFHDVCYLVVVTDEVSLRSSYSVFFPQGTIDYREPCFNVLRIMPWA